MTDKLVQALSKVIDPDIKRPITDLGMVSGLSIDAHKVAHATLHLTIASCPAARMLEEESIIALRQVQGVEDVDLKVTVMTPQEREEFILKVKGPAKPNQFDKNSLTRVIAVTSGKGGVGKSSVTVNLAVALATKGLQVGIIDADIFGFSIPSLIGLSKNGRTASPVKINDLIVAPESHGIKVVSIGMFLGEADSRNTAVSWRGPMLHRTLEQFLRDVWFGDLDVLLLDLPPGTGDVALSVGQLLPQAEVLVVTTPQTSASDVAVRSGILSFTSGQKILGVIENMGSITLEDGTLLDMFGEGGGLEVAQRLSAHPKNIDQNKVDLLGTIPLSIKMRKAGDAGVPVLLTDKGDPASIAIQEIVEKISLKRPSLIGTNLPINLS